MLFLSFLAFPVLGIQTIGASFETSGNTFFFRRLFKPLFFTSTSSGYKRDYGNTFMPVDLRFDLLLTISVSSVIVISVLWVITIILQTELIIASVETKKRFVCTLVLLSIFLPHFFPICSFLLPVDQCMGPTYQALNICFLSLLLLLYPKIFERLLSLWSCASALSPSVYYPFSSV